MNIQSIEVRRCNLGLTRPYTIAYKTVSHVENVLVEIRLDNGITGRGAANPSPQVVGEDVDGAIRALGPEQLQPFLKQDIRGIHGLLARVQQAFAGSAGARAALDIALHDAFCQFLGVPVASFLGQRIHSLPTSITIGIKPAAETLAEAKEYYDRGFRVLKVKLGISPEEDLDRLARLRAAYGDKVIIRVDANQGYSSNQLIRFFDRSRPFNLELIEQPLPASSVTEMKQLPSNIKKLIAADESLINPQDALKLAEAPSACGIFNIKLMKCGGIAPALEIGTIAKSAGIDLMWGCNDESIISITAALHAALSCERTQYIDLDGSLDLASDVVKGGFLLDQGMMSINGRPGLGLITSGQPEA